MARLDGFEWWGPAQGFSNYCGAAAAVCAGGYLGLPGMSEISDMTHLEELMTRKGAWFGNGAGAQAVLDFAVQLGMQGECRRGGLGRMGAQVRTATTNGRPVMVQWRPGKMGLAGEGFDLYRGHWSLVVEWPDNRSGRVILTDSFRDRGESAGPREWRLSDLVERDGLSRSPSWVFLRA